MARADREEAEEKHFAGKLLKNVFFEMWEYIPLQELLFVLKLLSNLCISILGILSRIVSEIWEYM